MWSQSRVWQCFTFAWQIFLTMQNKNHPVPIPLDDKKVEPPFLFQLSFCRKSFSTSSTRSRPIINVCILLEREIESLCVHMVLGIIGWRLRQAMPPDACELKWNVWRHRKFRCGSLRMMQNAAWNWRNRADQRLCSSSSTQDRDGERSSMKL